jgi:oligopeptide/dipeptide ABC transporter ATP-binding protein
VNQTAASPVLAVQGLCLEALGRRLVDEVSFEVAPGEMLGLVGESGCGKTVTALALQRLLPPAVRIAAGSIHFEGQDLATLDEASLRRLRGDRIAMIFQEPMTSLNPVFTVGNQIAEVLTIHRDMDQRQARQRAVELLERVGMAGARRLLDSYPHQLSGGQRQRVMIAMALACEPRLLIADEPTTALDVTVQAQILDLIDRLRRELGMACLLIAHDLGVVSEVCDRVAVMYAGRIVEQGGSAPLFGRPRHRYTRALLDTIPASNPPGVRLPAIAGQVPPPGQRGSGCSFAARCAAPLERCRTELPELTSAPGQSDTHRAACWNPVL